ncbi:hypothetical protein PENSPDRAFT_683456 [Peniophora sp. CONT]|nr:hypothetical protein PENSPDRAFT_683456 [Peniophora sp. CONT]
MFFTRLSAFICLAIAVKAAPTGSSLSSDSGLVGDVLHNDGHSIASVDVDAVVGKRTFSTSGLPAGEDMHDVDLLSADVSLSLDGSADGSVDKRTFSSGDIADAPSLIDLDDINFNLDATVHPERLDDILSKRTHSADDSLDDINLNLEASVHPERLKDLLGKRYTVSGLRERHFPDGISSAIAGNTEAAVTIDHGNNKRTFSGLGGSSPLDLGDFSSTLDAAASLSDGELNVDTSIANSLFEA